MTKLDKPLSQFLQESSWARSLPAAVCQRVVADAYETTHPENDIVARKGDAAHSWMGVADGLLKVMGVIRSGKVVVFSGVPEGSWIGEGSVIKRELRRYDIVAVRPTRLAHIPRATFHWLLDTNIDFNRFVIEHLNERLSQFMAMVETDRMSSPTTRLARAIIGLYNPVLYPRMTPLLRLSQEELGELAGLTRQRTNIAIKQLARTGLVDAQYGGLLINDLAGLRRCAEREDQPLDRA